MVIELNLDQQQKKTNPRIQILRGVAVLLVIFFHLGVPQFSGGFLGVDAFLVISGFFMHQIYSQNTSNHKVLNFYAKRMKRLLPAYLATACVVLIVSFFRFLPHERIHAVEQFLSSTLFTSNVTYWLGNQYFSASELRPTLSFWSLALEIQFYLIFPVLFWIFFRNYKIFITLNFLSLALFILLNKVSPESSFFLLLPRLWQFGLGMFCSKYLSAISKWVSRLKFPEVTIFRASLFMEITIVCLYRFLPSATTGIYNILICCLTGVALSTSADSFKMWRIEIWLNRLGNASYSMYLTHLPVIVLLCYVPFQGNNVPLQSTLKFSLSLLLTFVSGLLLYFIIEKPFRRIKDIKKLIAVYGITILAAFAFYINRTTLSGAFLDDRTTNISMALMDRSEFRCGVMARIEIIHKITGGPESCLITTPTSMRYLLVGNSHADAIKTALGEGLIRQGISLALLRDNMALTETNIALATSEALRLKVQGIVVHSSHGNTDYNSFMKLAKFAQANDLRLIVIGPVPTFDFSVPDYLLKHQGQKTTTMRGQRNDFQGYQDEVEFFQTNSTQFQYQFIDVEAFFCGNGCTISTRDGHPYYFDSGHLTLTGTRFLIDKIGAMLTRGLT